MIIKQHMLPDAGGVIEGEVTGASVALTLRDSPEGMYSGVTLDPTEARLLGRWLIRLANEANKAQAGRG